MGWVGMSALVSAVSGVFGKKTSIRPKGGEQTLCKIVSKVTANYEGLFLF